MSSATTPVSPDYPQTIGKASKPIYFQKTIAAVGLGEPLTEQQKFFQKATIWAFKAFTDQTVSAVEYVERPQNNASDIMIGFGSDSDESFKLPRVLAPGASVVIEAPPGQKFDLNQVYIKGATAGDGAWVEYS